MKFYSFLIATMAVAISTVYALPAEEPQNCLRLCRDAPLDCPAGYKSELITDDEQV